MTDYVYIKRWNIDVEISGTPAWTIEDVRSFCAAFKEQVDRALTEWREGDGFAVHVEWSSSSPIPRSLGRKIERARRKEAKKGGVVTPTVRANDLTLATALRVMAPDAVGTHDDQCFQRHRGCAMVRAAERLEELHGEAL